MNLSFDVLLSLFPEIINHQPTGGKVIGYSQNKRPVFGWKTGSGNSLISLIGGCHADEPVGPRFLQHLAAYLHHLPASHYLLQYFTWYIVPHVNPDGEVVNRKWYNPNDAHYVLGQYLQHVVRELPGDDLEFGFPVKDEFPPLRPENEAVYRFWKQDGEPFTLHASLHGMGSSYGPWFLLDPHRTGRLNPLKEQCREQVSKMGYTLNDEPRNGEKGFHRLEEGFATHPNGKAMRKFFQSANDEDTAHLFHASSMESVCSLGGNCLTLVTEMPLFLLPDRPETLHHIAAKRMQWKQQFNQWKAKLHTGKLTPEEVEQQAGEMGVKSMPVHDQMKLQWTLLAAALETIARQ